MADYLFAEDGKIHTRYTELTRCTPGQIERVIAERLGSSKRFQSDKLDFGTDRHDMWEQETRRTGQLPACFHMPMGEAWTHWKKVGLGLPVSHVECEFASEVLPGIIIHSRPDVVCEAFGLLGDYKTIIASSYAEGVFLAVQRYAKSRQLPFYAYQLGLHGIRIKRIAYLVEIWNRNQDEILGYKVIIKDFKMADIAGILPWVKTRVSYLASALEQEALARE